MFQLGQVVGVATLGTTHLSLVHAPGVQAPHMRSLVALALSALFAAGLSLALARQRAVAIG